MKKKVWEIMKSIIEKGQRNEGMYWGKSLENEKVRERKGFVLKRKGRKELKEWNRERKYREDWHCVNV